MLNNQIIATLKFFSASPSTTQFVLIDLSTRLNELASAMLDSLRSMAKDSILNFENGSDFDFGKLPQRSTVLFVSSEFAAKMTNKPKQVENVFILEDDASRADHRKRFATGKDLIFQLADELFRCYEREAIAYSTAGDVSTAKTKEEEANRIFSQLKQVHKEASVHGIATDTLAPPKTSVIWVKSESRDDSEVEKVKNLFSEIVSSFDIFDNRSDCRQNLSKYAVDDNIFLIVDTDYKDSTVSEFQQRPNVRLVSRFGQSSLENGRVIDNYYDLCSRLAQDLLVHFNKLGTEYSARKDSRTAKDMFKKAYKLCQIDFES